MTRSLAGGTPALAVVLGTLMACSGNQFDQGLGPEEIAARFGITTTVVRQRLKLAAVGGGLMQRYRDGELTLVADTVMLPALEAVDSMVQKEEQVLLPMAYQMLTEREWGAFRENLRLLFQTPVFVDYWNREQGIYTAEFREEVDALLREIEAGRTHDETSALFKKPEVGT